jgi:hypothetical protein
MRWQAGTAVLVSEWAGQDIAPLDHPLSSMAEMHAWVEDRLGSLFHGPQGRLRAFEAAFVQAKHDGVERLEIGEDVWAITLFDQDAPKLSAELVAVHSKVAPEIEWIPQFGLSRHCPINALIRWLAPFLELGTWRTLDLSGDELARPIESFRPLYRMVKDRGLRLRRMSANGVQPMMFGARWKNWSLTRFSTESQQPPHQRLCGCWPTTTSA